MRALAIAPALLEIEQLPRKPYCTDDLQWGLSILPRKIAVRKKYIQLNPPGMANYLMFDIDRSGAAFAWQDVGLPPPSWAATNRDNGHAHLVYRLASGVCTSPNGRSAPIRYLAAIEQAMGTKLMADAGYSGLITKNPLISTWKVVEFGRAHGYDLGELAEWVDLEKKIRTSSKEAANESFALGRNCSLFDDVRQWAYLAISMYWGPGGFEKWFDAVRRHAESRNQDMFPGRQLDGKEVAHVSKSIAKWTWTNMTPAGRRDLIERTHTPTLQAERGRKGGRPGLGNPWLIEGISRATWFRRHGGK